jgi:hypothetical protein
MTTVTFFWNVVNSEQTRPPLLCPSLSLIGFLLALAAMLVASASAFWPTYRSSLLARVVPHAPRLFGFSAPALVTTPSQL